jgi:hypothetical protein
MFATLKLFFTILLAAIFGAGPAAPSAPAAAQPARLIAFGPQTPANRVQLFGRSMQIDSATEERPAAELASVTRRIAQVRLRECGHTSRGRFIVVCPPPVLLR